jgi:hypothetical protein
MKRCERMRTVALWLLVAIAYLPVPIQGFSNMVSGQMPFAIEGKTYEGPVVTLPSPAGLRLQHTYYIFETGGKVRCRRTIIRLGHDATKTRYNPSTRKYETIIVPVPGEHSSTDEFGAYKQSDGMIQMDFVDRYIQAADQIQGSIRGLDGVTTFRNSQKKERFMVIIRIHKD